MLDFKAKMRQI